MEIVLFFFHILFQIFPCVVLCFIPFTHELARSKRKIGAQSAVAIIAFCLSVSLLKAYGFDIDSYNLVLAMLLLLPGFFYYRKTVRESVHKLLFIFFFVIHLGNMVSEMETIAYFLPGIYNMAREIVYLLRILFQSAVYLLGGWGMYVWFAPRLRCANARDIKGIWIVPLGFFIVSGLVSFFFYDYLTAYFSPVYMVASPLLLFISFGFNVLLLRIINSASENALLEAEVKGINRQLELQGEQYNMLREHIAETKTARHDLRHHLSLLHSYINAGEYEKLKAYVDEYADSLSIDAEVFFCDNYAVNSILRHYAEIAKNDNIRFEVLLELPENTGVNDSDFCIVFGNCIENAIEACRKLDEGRFIKISSKHTGKMLAITIDNSFDGKIEKAGDAFMSLNHEGEGIGISSVKAIAAKYGGAAQFEAKNDVFQASIMLRLK